MGSADHAGSSLVLSRLEHSWMTAAITGEWRAVAFLFVTFFWDQSKLSS